MGNSWVDQLVVLSERLRAENWAHLLVAMSDMTTVALKAGKMDD